MDYELFLQRLKDYFRFRSDSELEKTVGVGNGYCWKIKNGKINYPDAIVSWLRRQKLDVDYFLTGQGTAEPAEQQVNKTEKEQTSIPFYDIDVMAHIAVALDLKDEHPAGMLVVPGFNDCFACFPVYGNSMEPKISSGDIIAVSKAISVDRILWGEIYLVITDAWRVVKTVHPGETEEYIILRSINPAYSGDTPVKKDEVRALYLVRGIVSRLGM
jgi:hypothetical protein